MRFNGQLNARQTAQAIIYAARYSSDPTCTNHGQKQRRKKVAVTLPGTVEKIIPSIGDVVPEKAQIQVEGADDLYREVRIDNTIRRVERPNALEVFSEWREAAGNHIRGG
jgi:hypothetical protein